ncbi:MAG: hypothetical protein ACLGSA_05670 [Acidobacteriota bacterium]
MAWPILEKLGGMFGNSQNKPQPLGEVSVATCGLVEVDAALCARLSVGEDLPLSLDEVGRVAVMRTQSRIQAPLGYLPERESAHVAKLMGSKATLGCRVVQIVRSQGQAPLVRVRITIRM